MTGPTIFEPAPEPDLVPVTARVVVLGFRAPPQEPDK